MEENNVTPSSLALRYGLIISLLSIVLSLVVTLLGMQTNAGMSIVITVLQWGGFIVLLVVAQNKLKSVEGGFLSFGRGFGLAAIYTVVYSVTTAVFAFVSISFIDDSPLKEARRQFYEQMENDPNTTEESMEMAESMFNIISSPAGITISGFLGALFIGLLLSLIVTAVVQKPNRELDL